MVSKNLAAYEPQKQTRSVLLHWRLPEEWAEVLHEWVHVLRSVSSIHAEPTFPHLVGRQARLAI